MQASSRWFKLSVYSLVLAVIAVFGLPAGCAITSQDNSGWDFLSDDIHFLTVSAILISFFLFSSLVTGILALKENKIATLWVVPLGLLFVGAIGFSLYGLYIYFFDPFGTG